MSIRYNSLTAIKGIHSDKHLLLKIMILSAISPFGLAYGIITKIISPYDLLTIILDWKLPASAIGLLEIENYNITSLSIFAICTLITLGFAKEYFDSINQHTKRILPNFKNIFKYGWNGIKAIYSIFSTILILIFFLIYLTFFYLLIPILIIIAIINHNNPPIVAVCALSAVFLFFKEILPKLLINFFENDGKLDIYHGQKDLITTVFSIEFFKTAIVILFLFAIGTVITILCIILSAISQYLIVLALPIQSYFFIITTNLLAQAFPYHKE